MTAPKLPPDTMVTISTSGHPRRTKLPLPRLQWKLIFSFVGLSALSLLLQYLLFSARLSSLAADLPRGGEFLVDALPSTLRGVLFFSMLVLLPMCTALGILITFPWAGPLYRFQVYLRQVVAGEAEGPCRIRKRDELQGLCELINESLEVTRARAAAGDESSSQSASDSAGEDQSAAA